MLAQILHDQYVPPELLDGLPEDQKQLLFCKMREEQIRRYHEREQEAAAASKSTSTKRSQKRNDKHVTFRLDANGNEWCGIMGESELFFKDTNEPLLANRINDENDHQHKKRMMAGVNHTLPAKTGIYYTTYRDERKQIEEISNNIHEARRMFERLECDTHQLVLNEENEVLPLRSPKSTSSHRNDLVDEQFYHEVEQRAKQAEQDKRETARRARDNFRRNSLQLNVCFDTGNYTTSLLQAPPLHSSNKANRETKNEKKIHVEFVGKKPPVARSSSVIHSNRRTSEQTRPRSKPLLPLTREDIRQWFCTSELPYSTFRSSTGQIYPWFHGIITRSYAEQLLCSKPIGSYLIRINEKIFGYALSYRASDHCRHLLIEVILCPSKRDNTRIQQQQHAYRFLGGAQHEMFAQLHQLIEKYSNTPIRSNSTDVLRYPCGQIDSQKPDYADLFIENLKDQQHQSLYIPLDSTTSSPQSTTHL